MTTKAYVTGTAEQVVIDGRQYMVWAVRNVTDDNLVSGFAGPGAAMAAATFCYAWNYGVQKSPGDALNLSKEKVLAGDF